VRPIGLILTSLKSEKMQWKERESKTTSKKYFWRLEATLLPKVAESRDRELNSIALQQCPMAGNIDNK